MHTKIFIIPVMILAACSTTRVQHNTVSKNTTPSDDGIEKQINRFSLELFTNIQPNAENIFLSPFSIYQSAAMVYDGARKITYKQISEVLGAEGDAGTFLNDLSTLTNKILSANRNDSVQLTLANSAWIQENYPVLETFSQAQKKYFGSDLRRVDFIDPNHREISRKEINLWASEQTAGKIPDLIGENMLNDLTRLVLVNAVYFNGLWKSPFNKDASRKGDFHLRSGKTQEVTFMHREAHYRYFSSPAFQAVELPYLNSSLSMLIVLPANISKTDSIKNSLTPGVIESIYNGLTSKNVRLMMPRFKVTGLLNAKPLLEKMGMREAFTNKADFSGISGKDDLKIDRFFQKAYIRVNETGSEAAAATAVIMGLKAALNTETIDFRADHPFLFFIADRISHTILFMGQVENPEETE